MRIISGNMTEEIIVHTVQDLWGFFFTMCLRNFTHFFAIWLSFDFLSACWSSIIFIWTNFPSDLVFCDCLASIHDYKDVQGRHQHWNCIQFYSLFASLRSRWAGGPTSPGIYSSLINGWTENAVPFMDFVQIQVSFNVYMFIHKKEGKKKSWSLT